MPKNRICPSCGHQKLKRKRNCHNVLCQDSEPYKIKIKEERKMKKQKEIQERKIKRQEKKLLRAPKAGTSVKGRDGSTRHGMVISTSVHNKVNITIDELRERDKLLNIVPDKCFWCKQADKQCGDHAHPCCNTTTSEYAHTNVLNIFPSCDKCNSEKGGKRLTVWIDDYLPKKGWSIEEITIFKKWLNNNKDKLLLDEETTKFLERQFPHINDIHAIYEYCAKKKCDISKFITYTLPKDL